MHLRCGEILNDHLIANLLPSLVVKESENQSTYGDVMVKNMVTKSEKPFYFTNILTKPNLTTFKDPGSSEGLSRP